MYVLLVSPSLKFHSILLYGQPFLRYRIFLSQFLFHFARTAVFKISQVYNSPLTNYHIKLPQMNKKCPKNQISHFVIPFNNCGRRPPQEDTGILRGQICCILSEEFQVVFWNFTLIWSRVNENEKRQKSKIWSFPMLWTTFVGSLTRSIHIFRQWILCVLSEEMSFEILLPCGSMFTRRKKNHNINFCEKMV